MKRLYILLGMILSVSSIILFLNTNAVKAETTTTTINTTTSVVNSEDGNYYYYSDYNDLVSQIYQDVYADIYDDVYQQVLSDITQEFYNDIYDSVEEQASNLVNEDQIQVYVDDFQQKIYNVVDIADKSVFGITAKIDEQTGAIGSGVVYKYDETNHLFYIVTNHHVVENAQSFEIVFADQSSVPATLIGYDTEVDLAVLTFSSVGLPVEVIPATFGDSDQIKVSEFVMAVGNPTGYNFYDSVTLGVVSGNDRLLDANRYVGYIQHDAAINSGNSGGPIFNLDGQVVGINVSKYATIDIEGMGFAIPSNMVSDVAYRIENHLLPGDTTMPRLGAIFHTLSDVDNGDGTATLNNIYIKNIKRDNVVVTLPQGVTNGLIVRNVTKDQAFEEFFDGGDLIVKIDDYDLTDYLSMLDYLYDNYHAGDTITVSYYEFDTLTDIYDPILKTQTITLI